MNMIIIDELRVKYKSLIDIGYTTKQISDELNVSWSTVKRYCRKFGLKTIHYVEPKPLDRDQLVELVNKRFSTYKIANELGISQTTVRYWLKKFGLKTNSCICYSKNKTHKICPQCKQMKPLNAENFYIQKNGKTHAWCKDCNNSISLEKHRGVKQKAIDYKGGKCVNCGYNKYSGALDFHHIDPTTKDFTISDLRTYSWEKIKIELDKCICLCKNCHAELHAQKNGGPGQQSSWQPFVYETKALTKI